MRQSEKLWSGGSVVLAGWEKMSKKKLISIFSKSHQSRDLNEGSSEIHISTSMPRVPISYSLCPGVQSNSIIGIVVISSNIISLKKVMPFLHLNFLL